MLISVRIDDVAACHCHAQWAQRVQDADRSGMRGQHFGEAAVRLGRFVKVGATEYHALGLEPLHHLVVAHQARLADAFAADILKFTLGRRARHDPARSMHRRVQRRARDR